MAYIFEQDGLDGVEVHCDHRGFVVDAVALCHVNKKPVGKVRHMRFDRWDGVHQGFIWGGTSPQTSCYYRSTCSASLLKNLQL